MASRPLARRLMTTGLLVIAAAGLALAQPGTDPARGGRPGGGQPGRGEMGPGGQPGFNLDQFIDRIMRSDTDGDGRLSRAEAPPMLSERFDDFDSDGDGFITRTELQARAAEIMGRGPGGVPGAAPGGGAGRIPLSRAMQNAERALTALHESTLNNATRAADLGQVQALQESLLAAKFQAATERFPAPVLARFNNDAALARTEFRARIIETLIEALHLELAILDGDIESARAIIESLEDLEHRGHDDFRID